VQDVQNSSVRLGQTLPRVKKNSLAERGRGGDKGSNKTLTGLHEKRKKLVLENIEIKAAWVKCSSARNYHNVWNWRGGKKNPKKVTVHEIC